MAQIVIPIRDEDWPDVVAAFAATYTYQPSVTNPVTGESVPNPVTREQYVSVKTGDFVAEITAAWKLGALLAPAQAAATAALQEQLVAATAHFRAETGIQG